jgi:predicted 3-demethylubiquinone-9 3-methyltransferase (glyoxalase superfamily)
LVEGQVWFIVANWPANLGELLGNPDPKKAKNAMNAMLKIGKLDIAVLEAAGK